ncbi:MAG: tetratricopeptide repeat protein, partial [Cyclobacteriaceae bacterium]
VRLSAVEFDSKLSKEKTKNLEKDANALLANAKDLPKNNMVTAAVLEFLAGLAIYEKNYANGEKYLKSIVEIKSDLFGEQAPETHLARVKLANYYLDYTNNITESTKIYKESFDDVVAKEIGAWHKDHLDILNHLAILYELTDRFSDASQALDKAGLVARAKYDDTDFLYGSELTNIARLQIKLGEYEKAEESINKSLKILEEFRKDEDKKVFLISAIETQATLFGVQGLFDEAEDNLDRTRKIILRADNLFGFDELSTAQQLSSLYIQLGRYTATEELLGNLIKEYEKLYGKSSIRLIDPLVNSGRLSLAEGDYTEADKIAQRANQIAIAIYGDKSSKTASTQKLLGDIEYAIGDYERAEENIEKALTSQERQYGRNHIEVAKSLAQLSLVKFYKGDQFENVEKLMLEAQQIMGKRLGVENPQYA